MDGRKDLVHQWVDARAIKESLHDLSSYTRRGQAYHHFKKCYFGAMHSRLEPVIEKAQMIHKYIHNTLTNFAHPIPNAVTEGLNSQKSKPSRT